MSRVLASYKHNTTQEHYKRLYIHFSFRAQLMTSNSKIRIRTREGDDRDLWETTETTAWHLSFCVIVPLSLVE